MWAIGEDDENTKRDLSRRDEIGLIVVNKELKHGMNLLMDIIFDTNVTKT